MPNVIALYRNYTWSLTAARSAGHHYKCITQSINKQSKLHYLKLLPYRPCTRRSPIDPKPLAEVPIPTVCTRVCCSRCIQSSFSNLFATITTAWGWPSTSTPHLLNTLPCHPWRNLYGNLLDDASQWLPVFTFSNHWDAQLRISRMLTFDGFPRTSWKIRAQIYQHNELLLERFWATILPL